MSYTVDRRGLMRTAGAGVAAIGLGGALASCGSDESETVTLTWWDYFTLDNFQPGMNRLIRDVEAGVPNVRIQRRTFPFTELDRQITLGAISGERPDIAIVDNVAMNTLGAAICWPTSPAGSRRGARLTSTTKAPGTAAGSAGRSWGSPTTATASPSTTTPGCSSPPEWNPHHLGRAGLRG